MSKVITFSRYFPSYHPRAGEPTYFVEKIWNWYWQLTGSSIDYKMICDLNPDKPLDLLWNFWKSIEKGIEDTKGHTIRGGNRFKVDDWFSPRVWSGKPYNSKQIIIAPDIQVKKVWDFKMKANLWFDECEYYVNGKRQQPESLRHISKNDGLEMMDFACWFAGKNIASSSRKNFDGQIICCNEKIEY